MKKTNKPKPLFTIDVNTNNDIDIKFHKDNIPGDLIIGVLEKIQIGLVTKNYNLTPSKLNNNL